MLVTVALLCASYARAEGVGSAFKATIDGVSDTVSSRAKVVQDQIRGGFIGSTTTGVVDGATATFKDLRETVETRLGKVADAVETVRDIVRGDDEKSEAEKKVREDESVFAPRRTLAALATLASTSIVARTTAAIPRHRVTRKKDDVSPAKDDAPFYYREGRHTTATTGVSSAPVPQRTAYYRPAGAAAMLAGEATVVPSDAAALYYRPRPEGAATLSGASVVAESEKPAYYRPADGFPVETDESLAALAYYRTGLTSAPVAGISTEPAMDEFRAGYYRPPGGFEYVPDEELNELPYYRTPPTSTPVQGLSDRPTDVRPQYHRPLEGFAVEADPSLNELAYYRTPPTSAPLVGATVNSTALEKPAYHRPASGFVSDGEADVLGGVAYYREPPTNAPVSGSTVDEPPVAHSYYREFRGKRPRPPRRVKKVKPQRRVAPAAAAKPTAVPEEPVALPKGVSAEDAPYKYGAPTYYRPSKEAVPKATYVPVNGTAAAQAPAPSYYRPPESAAPTPSKGPANVPKYYRPAKRLSSTGLRK